MNNIVSTKSNLSISILLLFLSIISFPFYILPSGGVQISSLFFLLLGFFAWAKVDRDFYLEFNRILIPYYFFISYVLLISLAWSIIVFDLVFFNFAIFYIFNFIVLFGISVFLANNRKFFDAFPKMIAISVILQFVLSLFLGGGDSLRGSLFFNNPNQLGYYSLTSAAILVVFFKKKYISSYWFYPAILATLWLAQISLSTATLISILILLAYSVFSSFKSFIFSVLISLVLLLMLINYQDLLIDRTYIIWDRFNAIGENSDDSLAGRGYDRIWNHPVITLIGGGEGAVYRWNSFLSESELHSTWGTLLFSYGIIGFSLFIVFLKNIIYSEKLITFIPFLAIALYGITHNGLRFIYFWIFLAVCVALKLKKD